MEDLCPDGKLVSVPADELITTNTTSSTTYANAPTPLPSQSPTTSPSLSPSRLPPASPSTSPTKLPTHSPSGSPTKLLSVTTTSSTTSSSTDGKWYPATVNAERTCKFGSDYPAVYAEYGFLYEDEVDENKLLHVGTPTGLQLHVLPLPYVLKDDI